ncbi:tRNA lysidine(34) synthetase TilS [Nocardioides sp. Kera G14]|uniref:tRNA lysidine(34) synthetase TilS n=1 Tax=Nocardioides sp. Kera G14 TaxID=2884264 RepID=UPI001D1225ED|nr:tRNA lysidine(34) synthetase TilS [Nocardioides sp. Kera G14]UDY23840.1 tRNA lysidine(34) synthetase TilS [Nocardioides sp. Kera G14]
MTLHPSIAAVRRGVRQTLADSAAGDTVVVAVSGGPDSMALASAAIFEGHKLGLTIIGATVDHDLQLDSDKVAAQTAERLRARGIDETATIRVRVEDPDRAGPESAARSARYAALEQYADHVGATAVLLGHTRDDQAETVLLGLARGSGPRSIAGMRRTFGRFRRPLLDVTRDDTVTACQVEGIETWHDPHNDDPGYARVRVRQAVLPTLEQQLGPGIAETLARTADQVRQDVDLLDDIAVNEWQGLGGSLRVDVLTRFPGAIRTRLLRLAALEAGAPGDELTYGHIEALDALLTDWHGQRWIDLPGHLRATRSDGEIRLLPWTRNT